MTKKYAAKFANEVKNRKPGNCARIVRVLLPSGMDKEPYADIEF